MRTAPETRLTRSRREWKALLAPDLADRLVGHLQQAFQTATPPECTVTSVYFDTTDGRLARAALAGPGLGLKVRTREYAADWGAPHEARCVVVLKRRFGEVTRKNRFWIPRAALPHVFGPNAVSPGPPDGSARPARRCWSPAIAARATTRAAPRRARRAST